MLVNVRILLASLLITATLGCSRPSLPSLPNPNTVSAKTVSHQERDSARQQLDLIPPPSKNRYKTIRTLDSWENPYLTVQGDMLTLHITRPDANPSTIGLGTIMRPTAARRETINVAPADLAAALIAIPNDAWPYGRVMAVEEAHNTPIKARPNVRRNLEATMATLTDLGIVVDEWTEQGPATLR